MITIAESMKGFDEILSIYILQVSYSQLTHRSVFQGSGLDLEKFLRMAKKYPLPLNFILQF